MQQDKTAVHNTYDLLVLYIHQGSSRSIFKSPLNLVRFILKSARASSRAGPSYHAGPHSPLSLYKSRSMPSPFFIEHNNDAVSVARYITPDECALPTDDSATNRIQMQTRISVQRASGGSRNLFISLSCFFTCKHIDIISELCADIGNGGEGRPRGGACGLINRNWPEADGTRTLERAKRRN